MFFFQKQFLPIQKQTKNTCLSLRHCSVLVDDTEKIWEKLSKTTHPVRVDFVLDNAGPEIFSDLCLATFLSSKGIADKIVFHVKQFPWFVSDATHVDFHWIVDQCCKYPEGDPMRKLGEACKVRNNSD